MIAVPHNPAVRGRPVPAAFTPIEHANVRLRLLASGDGWSLVGVDGQLVFSALGTHARRRCLEYAHSTGVLTLLS